MQRHCDTCRLGERVRVRTAVVLSNAAAVPMHQRFGVDAGAACQLINVRALVFVYMCTRMHAFSICVKAPSAVPGVICIAVLLQ